MAKKLSEKSLMKKLEKMDKEQLQQIILDLYKSSAAMSDGINMLIQGEVFGKELLEKYKKKLYKVFYPTNIVRTGFSLERAQDILSEFAEKCAGDNEGLYGDFALYFAECATDFTMTYGDIGEKFYDALGDVYHDAVVAAGKNKNIYILLQDRLENILHEFSGFGWGMETYITREYYSIPWVKEE